MSDDSTSIWYQDTTEHVREILALREQVATLTRERDEARHMYVDSTWPPSADTPMSHTMSTRRLAADQCFGEGAGSQLYPETAPTPTTEPE